MMRFIVICFLLTALWACGGGGGAGTAASNNIAPINLPPGPSIFNGNIVLGAPTDNSIAIKVFSADQAGSISVDFGKQAGQYSQSTKAIALQAGQVALVSIDGLSADTLYYYRLNFQPTNAALGLGAEYSFHTARPPGRTFSFTVQADSHLDENSSLDQYRNTLANVLFAVTWTK